MAALKLYTAYKDSGVEWLGEIPQDWEVTKIKNIACLRQRSISSEKLSTKTWYYYDIPTIQQIGEGKVEHGENIDSNKYLLVGNEILVSKLNPRKGTVVRVKVDNDLPIICSTELIPFIPVGIDPGYLYYCFNNKVTADVFNSMVTSVTNSHQRINPKNIEDFIISIPSFKEQETISKYLDTKTSEIDALIADKDRLITLLEEKRQAVITETVTKGLDPNAKMKDSGIEWIGEVLEHWDISRIKYQVEINKRTLNEQTDKLLNIKYIDIGSVNSNGEIEAIENYIFEHAPSRARRILTKGDTLVSTVRTYLKAITWVDNSSENLIGSTGFAVLTPKKTIKAKYLSYLMRSSNYIDEIVARSTGVSYPAITANEIGNLQCILPPFEEQERIACYINSSLLKIDQLKTDIEIQISKLKEYRESLIYEAVTGKIDVRDYADEKKEVY